jgi:ribonuclease G
LPEWLIERGIGETRAVLVDDGEIIEAQIELDGAVPAGSILQARLTDIGFGGRNAIAVDVEGREYLLPKGALGVTQGAAVTIEITRDAVPGNEPWKRPLARVTDEAPLVLPPLAERLAGRELVFPAPRDELNAAGWDALLDEARTGNIPFPGGELRISQTPAMTLIDVDGNLAPGELAVLGARHAAAAIRRLDIGGSIGIDLPTVAGKAVRQLVGDAIDASLPKPFERTAMNGFGFIQIVRPRQRAALIEQALDRTSFEARALLRRGSSERAGPKRLVAHPALISALEMRPDWLRALGNQVGGAVSLRADPNLPMSGGYAENL